MQRRVVNCVAVIAVLLPLPAGAGAQPEPDANPKPKGGGITVTVTARLFEVDDAFSKKLAKAKRLSKADLEELERQALDPQQAKPAAVDSPFALLEKQKLLFTGKEVNIDPGKEGVLLTVSEAVSYLPTPDELQRGKNGPQTVHVGFSLRAQVQVSGDRRFVRAMFVEKSLEVEGTERVKVSVGEKGTEALGEIVFLKEGSLSQTRDIPDGASFLLPLQYRPRAARDKDRWLVAEIVPRIDIEEEGRPLRGRVRK
jgi:hypothetical protein